LSVNLPDVLKAAPFDMRRFEEGYVRGVCPLGGYLYRGVFVKHIDE